MERGGPDSRRWGRRRLGRGRWRGDSGEAPAAEPRGEGGRNPSGWGGALQAVAAGPTTGYQNWRGEAPLRAELMMPGAPGERVAVSRLAVKRAEEAAPHQPA